MKPRATPTPSRRRSDPAADSAAAEAVDTPSGAQSLATPPADPGAPGVEPTGHYGPGYGDPTPVDPVRAKPVSQRAPQRRKDDPKPDA
jgi:hypothetical protein